MPFARTSDGLRVHYTVIEPERGASSAVPLVMVNGLGLSSAFWFGLPQKLANDGPRPRTVVLVDNRGTGKSEVPRRPYRMARLADDVTAVMDAAGIERAIIVGLSMGGMVAQHVALLHPHRVEGLVLLATSPGIPHGRFPTARTVGALLSLPFARKGSGRIMSRLLLPRAHVHRGAELLRQWPDAFRAEPVPPSTFFTQLGAILTHSTGFALHRVRCPAVVVTGDDDVLVPPANSRVLAKRLRRSQLHVLENCGHAIHAVDDDAVARALETLESMRHEAERARKTVRVLRALRSGVAIARAALASLPRVRAAAT